MVYLAYDTETTGLPVDPSSQDIRDTNNWPRVYQIGAILFDDMGFELDRMNAIIKPEGWVIPVLDDFMKDLGHESFHEKLGITTEYLTEVGESIETVMPRFMDLAMQADELVCHNAAFDRPIISCEVHRSRVKYKQDLNLQSWVCKKQHCTKLMSEPVCKIPGWKGKYKWPTLQEAYVHFFGSEFDGAHDAMADVQATMDVFLELKCLE